MQVPQSIQDGTAPRHRANAWAFLAVLMLLILIAPVITVISLVVGDYGAALISALACICLLLVFRPILLDLFRTIAWWKGFDRRLRELQEGT